MCHVLLSKRSAGLIFSPQHRCEVGTNFNPTAQRKKLRQREVKLSSCPSIIRNRFSFTVIYLKVAISREFFLNDLA